MARSRSPQAAAGKPPRTSRAPDSLAGSSSAAHAAAERYGVFIECPDEGVAPVLVRQCANRWEACGWREDWKVDGFIQPKMTIRPIDEHGQPTEEEAENDAVKAM